MANVSAGEVSESVSRGVDASGRSSPVAASPQATNFAATSLLPLKNSDIVAEASAATLVPFSRPKIINRPPDAPDAGVLDPPLKRLFDDYFTSFMNGLLLHNGLDPSLWRDSAVDLCQSCAQHLSIDVFSKDETKMDIRHYVHIKRIPGEHPSSSESFPGLFPPQSHAPHTPSQTIYASKPFHHAGVVMSNNVLHKGMRDSIPKARVLIFDCPLESDQYRFERDAQGNQGMKRVFTFLEFMASAEEEYCAKFVKRVCSLPADGGGESLKPDIVFCTQNCR